MAELKQVIKYDNAVAIEATWVDVKTIGVADSDNPTLLVTKEVERVVRCHAYSGDQMQMFRDDVAQYGGNIAEYEPLISEVEAAWVPPPVVEVPSPVDPLEKLREFLAANPDITAVLK